MKRTIMAIAILTALNTANAALYEISYISNDYGSLGSFTIESQDILDNQGDNPLGGSYVLNDFIQSLSFSYNGMNWGTDDIATGPTTAHSYTFIGDTPTSPSGNGSLATNELGQSITTYHPSIGVRFGDEYILGRWESSVATVPLPASIWFMLSGLIGLFSFAKYRKS